MAARCRRLHAAAAEGKMSNVVTGDVAASHCGLGHAVGVTRTLRQSSIQFKQLLQMSGSGPGGGKSYRDGLMARLHDACCSGARFNVYPQTHYSLWKWLEKIRCMLVEGCINSPPLYPPLLLPDELRNSDSN